MQPIISANSVFFHNVLQEDIGICGDITTESLISHESYCDFYLLAKEDLVVAGLPLIGWYFTNYSTIKFETNFKDGDFVKANTKILTAIGRVSEVLLLERTILNFLQHLSAIATKTSLFVEKVKDLSVIITDTRKTIPGMRFLQKYAVRCGGGHNHRNYLDSCILIKDNHIALLGSVTEALKRAKQTKPHYTKIIIECDTIAQFKEALNEGAEIIMLDNMSPDMVRDCSGINNNQAFLEVSGGIILDNVRAYAEAGANLISVGSLTHSVKAMDISLDIINIK